jgi:hypothetical protein
VTLSAVCLSLTDCCLQPGDMSMKSEHVPPESDWRALFLTLTCRRVSGIEGSTFYLIVNRNRERIAGRSMNSCKKYIQGRPDKFAIEFSFTLSLRVSPSLVG